MWLDLILDCPFLAFLARNYFHWCNKSLLTLYTPYSSPYVTFVIDKENSFEDQSFLGW